MRILVQYLLILTGLFLTVTGICSCLSHFVDCLVTKDHTDENVITKATIIITIGLFILILAKDLI